MIKRIIGLLAAVAVIAVIVFAVMNRSKYSSMIDWPAAKPTSVPAAKRVPAHRPQPAPAVDSLALGRE